MDEGQAEHGRWILFNNLVIPRTERRILHSATFEHKGSRSEEARVKPCLNEGAVPADGGGATEKAGGADSGGFLSSTGRD